MSGGREIHAEVPSPVELERLKRDRAAALLRRWLGGSALTPVEMAEVAHIIPAEHLAHPPPPKINYLHDYAFYASQLGYDVRNIKRLVATGKLARTLPPFDDPGRLADWWEHMRLLGHLKQQVPQRILDFLLRLQPSPAAPATPSTSPLATTPTSSQPSSANATSGAGAPTPPSAPPDPSAQHATSRINFAELEAIGLEGAVRELTLQLAAAQKDLREAREQGLPEVTLNRRQKSFDATLDSLRKTEKAWQDLQKDRGDLAPISDFRKDLTTIATTLRGMMKRRADNVLSALSSSLNPDQLGLVRASIEAEGQRELVLLRSARHWQHAPDGTVVAD